CGEDLAPTRSAPFGRSTLWQRPAVPLLAGTQRANPRDSHPAISPASAPQPEGQTYELVRTSGGIAPKGVLERLHDHFRGAHSELLCALNPGRTTGASVNHHHRRAIR